MKRIALFAAFVLFLGGLLFAYAGNPSVSYAQPQTGTGDQRTQTGDQRTQTGDQRTQTGQYVFEVKNPLKCPDLQCVLGGIVKLLVYRIAPAIVTFMVIVGAFQILTAAGNPEKFKKGRQTILYAAIGFAIVLLAGSVGALIQSFLSEGASGSSSRSSLEPFEYDVDVYQNLDYTLPTWDGQNPVNSPNYYNLNPYADLSGGGSGGSGAGGSGGSYGSPTQGCSYYINPQDYCIQTGGSDCGRISKDGPPVCVANGNCSNSVNPQEYCRRIGGADCASISPDGPRVCLN